MDLVYNFLDKHSHEIYCWSWALFISSGCLIFLLIIDKYWNIAYQKGYEKGLEDAK